MQMRFDLLMPKAEDQENDRLNVFYISKADDVIANRVRQALTGGIWDNEVTHTTNY